MYSNKIINGINEIQIPKLPTNIHKSITNKIYIYMNFKVIQYSTNQRHPSSSGTTTKKKILHINLSIHNFLFMWRSHDWIFSSTYPFHQQFTVGTGCWTFKYNFRKLMISTRTTSSRKRPRLKKKKKHKSERTIMLPIIIICCCSSSSSSFSF